MNSHQLSMGYLIASGKADQSRGAAPIGAFGKLVATGAVTKNFIWPNGTFTAPNQTTGEDITFVSTSAQDAAGGTGAITIEVHYLDINLKEDAVTITMAGLTPVTGQLSGCRFIQCMHITSTGSTLAAVGQINAYKATDAAAIYSIIGAGAERCTSSLRMVPAGKICYMAGAIASSVSITADAYADVEIIATELDTHQYIDPFLYIGQGSIGTQNNGIGYVFPVPLKFKAGTIVGMRATTNKAALISGDWFGWTEDA